MEEIVGSIYVSPEVYWFLIKNEGKETFKHFIGDNVGNSYFYSFKKGILQIIQFQPNCNCSCYYYTKKNCSCYYYTKKIEIELGKTINVYEFIEPIYYA